MTGRELAQIYEFSYGAIQRNLDGLTHEDSVLCPRTRRELCQLGSGPRWSLGEDWSSCWRGPTEPCCAEDEGARYRRGSAALREGGERG